MAKSSVALRPSPRQAAPATRQKGVEAKPRATAPATSAPHALT